MLDNVGVLGVLFESCKCAGQRGSVRLIFAGGERSGWSGCGRFRLVGCGVKNFG